MVAPTKVEKPTDSLNPKEAEGNAALASSKEELKSFKTEDFKGAIDEMKKNDVSKDEAKVLEDLLKKEEEQVTLRTSAQIIKLKNAIQWVVDDVNSWKLKKDDYAKTLELADQLNNSWDQSPDDINNFKLTWNLNVSFNNVTWRFSRWLNVDDVQKDIKSYIDKVNELTGSYASLAGSQTKAVENKDSGSKNKNDKTMAANKPTATGSVDKKDDSGAENEKSEQLDKDYLWLLLWNLKKFEQVLKSPTPQNTKALQQFIYDNLDDADKQVFKAKNTNKRTKKFDGIFWAGTLDGLKKILKKVDSYIQLAEVKNTVSSALNSISENLKKKIDEKDKNRTDGRSNGRKPSFARKPASSANGYSSGSSLDYVNSQNSVNVQNPLNGQNNVSVSNNVSVTGPNAVSGYTAASSSRVESQPSIQNQLIVGTWAREYLLNKNEKSYKLKTDLAWNLCPVVDETNNHVSGLTAKAIIKNNESCKNYLKTAIGNIPDASQIKIGWNYLTEDYTLISHWQSLNIEPMTLDWKWISGDLSTDLKLLNLTNYLRSNDVDLKWDNPNVRWKNGTLQVRLNKDRGNWRRGNVDLTSFGLSGGKINDEMWKKFKKYNNGEHWEDNWDDKKPNRYYSKIDIGNWVPTIPSVMPQNNQNQLNNIPPVQSNVPPVVEERPTVNVDSNSVQRPTSANETRTSSVNARPSIVNTPSQTSSSVNSTEVSNTTNVNNNSGDVNVNNNTNVDNNSGSVDVSNTTNVNNNSGDVNVNNNTNVNNNSGNTKVSNNVNVNGNGNWGYSSGASK